MSPRIELLDLAAQRARLGGAIEAAMAKVVEHGAFIMGPEVAELEGALSGRTGAGHVVTCASGTDALLLPLLAWGLGAGDAVFVPALTFPASPEVVALLGAVPVFVDVDPEVYDLDPASLERAVEWARAEGLRPAAVLPVDLYGLPARYAEISAIATATGMPVLADAAQSFGATQDGVEVGCLATVTATSFFPAKPLGCYGDGGAVFTDDGDLAAVLRSLRVHGQGSGKYDVQRVGVNARMDTLQAAVLLAKLAVYDEELAARRAIAARYSEALAGVVGTPGPRTGAASAWAQYTIRVPAREALVVALREAGVPTAVHYPRPAHHQPAYVGYPAPDGAPVATSLAEQVLSLPLHPYLTTEAQDHVIASVCSAAAS